MALQISFTPAMPRDRAGSRGNSGCPESGGSFITYFSMTGAYFAEQMCLLDKNKVIKSRSIYILHENDGKYIR